jgi:NAD+ synthase (glutamine-hydrolysing)
MDTPDHFFNLYRHGFLRTAVCIPEVQVADPSFNAEKTIEMARKAHEGRAVLAVFPELGLTAYSNEDLFHQDALLASSKTALQRVLDKTKALCPVIIIGMPLRVDCRLFNCAVVLQRGRILGIAVKSYLPNYREFYEARQFAPADTALSRRWICADRKKSPSAPTSCSKP